VLGISQLQMWGLEYSETCGLIDSYRSYRDNLHYLSGHWDSRIHQFSYEYIYIYIKVKVKFTLEQVTKGQRESRSIPLLFGAKWKFVVHAPTALRPENTRCPWYKRLGGPQARPGRVRKISPHPGFDPRTVQPIASHYTDWAIPVLLYMYI
jgi:hypothetical protein